MSLLTPRQREVLELVAAGYTSAEIARQLHRSVRTVESHRLKISRALGAKNQADLLRKARKAGLIETDLQDQESFAGDDATSAEAMLNSLCSAASISESGEGLLRSICKQLLHAFGAQSAAICRITRYGEVWPVVSWSHEGEFVLPEWNYLSSPCALLGWGEIATIPFEDLPHSMSTSFSSICNNRSSITLVPLRRSADKQMGVLCLTHSRDLDLSSAAKPMLTLCSAWISSELCSSVYRKDLQAIGFELGDFASRSNTVTFRCDKEGKLVWISSHLRELVGEVNDRSTRDVVSLLKTIAGNRNAPQIEELTACIRGYKFYSTSFTCESSRFGNTRLYFKLQPTPNDTGHAGDFVGVIDFAGSPVQSVDETTFLSALQMLVSKQTNPAVLMDWSGDIIAASDAWRKRLKHHGLLGTLECGNYFGLLRRIGKDEIAAQVEHAMMVFEQDDSRNTLRLRLTPGADPAEFGTAVEVTRIPGSESIFIQHAVEFSNTNDDGESPLAEIIEANNGVGVSENKFPQLRTPFNTFDWMFDHSHNAMCVCSLDGALIRVNPAMANAFECTQEELQGIRYFELFYPQDHVHVRELINRLSSGRPIEQAVLPMRTRRGNRILIDWSCPPVLPGTDLFTPVGRLL